MIFKKLSEKKWYNGAVVICIGVAFYVLLTHLGTVLNALGTFIGFFKPVIIGIVIAYCISPLAKYFYYNVLKKMKLGTTRWYVSAVAAFVLTLLVLLLLIGTLIPQLLQSLSLLTNNFDSYSRSLIDLLSKSPLRSFFDRESLELASANALASISGFLKENAGSILSAAANSGKGFLTTIIALILAVYLLLDSRRILAVVRHFLQLVMPQKAYEIFLDFTLRCDTILVNYVVQSLLDSLIVGGICAIFMAFCRMPYIGLISVAQSVTNLIPNFGPVIGAAIGGFILLLINPMQALIYIIFCVVMQFVDGYILKPKLFSSSLGVSGLLILIATIVLGNMFGIVGILLAIPAAAVLSFIYKDYFLPWAEARKRSREREA